MQQIVYMNKKIDYKIYILGISLFSKKAHELQYNEYNIG